MCFIKHSSNFLYNYISFTFTFCRFDCILNGIASKILNDDLYIISYIITDCVSKKGVCCLRKSAFTPVWIKISSEHLYPAI